MKDGVVEVWENQEANLRLSNCLVEKIKNDKKFFPDVYSIYLKQLRIIETWWKKDIKTIPELKTFVDLVYSAVPDFIVIYGALADKRIPANLHKMAEKMRKDDKFFDKCDKTIREALKAIYPKNGGLEVYMTKNEIKDKIPQKVLKKRNSGFAIVGGFMGTVSFDQLISKFPEFEFEVDEVPDGNRITGQTAYPGKTKGLVKILKRKDQIHEVKTGEVIVSPMTTPDFLPAMRQAVAFITDEGGITCHAAIIARELKKPCIVGTKFATSIFKDGDLIEVDAYNGTVKLIKRNPAKSLVNK